MNFRRWMNLSRTAIYWGVAAPANGPLQVHELLFAVNTQDTERGSKYYQCHRSIEWQHTYPKKNPIFLFLSSNENTSLAITGGVTRAGECRIEDGE